ncbi:MAG: F0F1 ATP synthase subunit epsilon [Saccharofermentans sp.]|nr:F0F1 ATP synthase subunit epsilon [Saccharofermentans sp.]
MNKFALKVITPQGVVIDKLVAGFYLRGSEGDLAVFAGHVPFVTSVREGKCTIVYDDSSEDTEAVAGSGMLSVSGDSVTLMTSSWKICSE